MNKIKAVRYPIYVREKTLVEKIALKFKIIPIKCPICGAFTVVLVNHDNFREGCHCWHCSSFNRQRQIAKVLLNSIGRKNIRSLKDLSTVEHLSIYNTEAWGSLHNYLSKVKGYVFSEYFGPNHKSGEFIEGKLHEDLMSLSFPDNKFDYVISTDVFEHIPDPYAAHQEIYRVLTPGGRHIFTVPFYQQNILDEKRAYIDDEGNTIHNAEPWYHVDPLSPEGILTFTVFSIEMLVRLAQIGFQTDMYLLYYPWNGILGSNGLVFEAKKPL